MSSLATEFKISLQRFLVQPESTLNCSNLSQASSAIYKDAIKNCGIDPDKYMDYIDGVIKRGLQDIKISAHSGVVLDNFLRELSLSDSQQDNQAFHPLTLAYNQYLKRHFISNAEEEVRKQLFILGETVQQFKVEHYVSAIELETAHTQLKSKIEQHFKLPLEERKKNYPVFNNEINALCKTHIKAIESNVLVKTVFYNLLCAVAGLGIFYGLYLAATSRSRGRFFLQPDENAVKSIKELNKLTENINADFSEGNKENTESVSPKKL